MSSIKIVQIEDPDLRQDILWDRQTIRDSEIRRFAFFIHLIAN